MPWYGFIHPVVALATIAYGLVMAQTGLSKVSDWDFPLRKQRERAVLFLLLCVVNFVIGFFVATAIRGRGTKLTLMVHMPLSIAVLTLALVSTVGAFARSRPGETSRFVRWHGPLTGLALALILTQGFLAALSLL